MALPKLHLLQERRPLPILTHILPSLLPVKLLGTKDITTRLVKSPEFRLFLKLKGIPGYRIRASAVVSKSSRPMPIDIDNYLGFKT